MVRNHDRFPKTREPVDALCRWSCGDASLRHLLGYCRVPRIGQRVADGVQKGLGGKYVIILVLLVKGTEPKGQEKKGGRFNRRSTLRSILCP